MRSILSWAFTGVGLILALAGVATFISALRRLFEAAGSKNWPNVPGKVVSSEVRLVTRKIQFEGEPEKLVHEHRVEVRYEYTINGVLLSGIDLGEAPDQSTSEKWAQERAARYPKDTDVRVFYSPKDPTRSVLEPGLAKASFVPLLIAITLLVAGTATVLISRLWLAPG